VAQAEPEPLVAAYTADGDCPDRTEFVRRVRARLSTSAPLARSVRFDVRLVRVAGGVQGTLQLVGQPTRARELSAPSCREAADALALVAALMLGDASAEKRTSEATRSQPRAARRPDQRSGGQTAPGGSAPAADPLPSSAGASGSGKADGVVAPGSANSELNSDDAPPSTRTASPTRTTGDALAQAIPRPPSERFFTDWRMRVSLGGLAAWGMAPQVRAGADLSTSFSARPRAGGPRFAVGLGARGVLPHQVRIPEGKASFRWVAFASSLCIEGPEHRFSVSGCALLETGWIDGRSSDGQLPRERRRFWGAVGPTLAGSVLLHPRFGLRLGGELLGVLVRDRFLLAERVLYSVPRLAFRAELGLYFVLW
jgi:hypothetical protein